MGAIVAGVAGAVGIAAAAGAVGLVLAGGTAAAAVGTGLVVNGIVNGGGGGGGGEFVDNSGFVHQCDEVCNPQCLADASHAGNPPLSIILTIAL